MNNRDRIGRVLKLVNLARASYGASELESLQGGQLHSASFCPIGRSLRKGVEDWLFVAVGGKHLRVWTLGKEPAAIAKQIMTAWEMPHKRLEQSGERSGFVILPLPVEICEFLEQFDRGLVPDYRGEADRHEVRQLRELARGMPIPGRHRSSWINHLRGGAQTSTRANI